MENTNNNVDLVARLFLMWGMAEKSKEYDPEYYDKEINEYPLIKILKHKLEWAGVDIVLPDYLTSILATCANSPGYIQLIMVDLLDYIYEKHGSIPKHYIVAPIDFICTFNNRFPVIEAYSDIAEEYSRKWDAQKLEERTPLNDNKIDTHEFWSKYKNV